MTLDAALRDPVVDGPDAEGFYSVTFPGDGHNASYGAMLARAEGPDTARVRIPTGRRAANVLDAVHGGFLLSFLDQALFVGPVMLERISFGAAVTLGVSTQFLASGAIDRPLDCMIEIVRETGRLLFLRGEIEQGGNILLTYQATVRKLSGKAG
jgi:acyl-coenzyme A thioesterase PaaI-like protein